MTDKDTPESTVNENQTDTPTTDTPQVDVPAKSSGVTITRPVSLEQIKDSKVRNAGASYLYGPSGYSAPVVGDALTELVGDGKTKRNLSDSQIETVQALYYGESLRQADKMLDPAINDTDRDFQQGVPYNGGTIGTRAPKLDDSEESLKGLTAVHAVNAALGLGGSIYQPLWGAGFQISFTPPPLKARHEFDFMAAVKKERFGWLTGGFSFSASELVIMSDAIRFAMKYMHSCTYYNKDITEILKAIPLTDCHTLLGSFAATIFPDGFPMVRACPHCSQTYKTTCNIPRMLLADNNKINDEQREIISLTPASKKRLTLEQHQRYQSQHCYNQNINRYEVTDYGFVFYFKVPSIFTGLEQTDKWTNEIRDTLVSSMGSEVTDNQRDIYMSQRAANTILRQYGHWVEKLVVRGKTIDDQDDINDALVTILEHDEVKTAFVAHIRKFIRYATIGVVVLPPHECPHCKAVIMDPEESQLLPETVAVDPLELFFRLMTLSIQVTLPE